MYNNRALPPDIVLVSQAKRDSVVALELQKCLWCFYFLTINMQTFF